MKSKIVKIGNSKCIRVPKSFIEQCNIKDDISIMVVNKKLLIEPMNNIRKDWDKKFSKNSKQDELIIDCNNDFDSKEWEW